MIATLLCTLLAGGESAPSPRPLDDRPTDFMAAFGGFWEAIELDEITTDVLASNGMLLGEADLPDVERDRLGIALRVGSEAVAFGLSVFVEEFIDEIYDDAGVEIGIHGTPRLAPDRAISPIVDYGVTVAVAGGEGDVPVVDANSGLVVGFVEQEIAYLEERLHLGVGVDAWGLQATVGLQADFIQGSFEVDDSSSPLDGIDGDFDGSNAGAYARVAYRGRDVPVTCSVTAWTGNFSGVGVQLGVRF